MEREEYWLLDAAIYACIELDIVQSEEDTVSLLNRPWHGMTSERLISTFEQLFRTGRLFGYTLRDGKYSEHFAPTRQDIVDALGRRINLYYGVTQEGGVLWESVSDPNWDMYLDYWWDLEEGCVRAATRRLVEGYLETRPFSGVLVVPGSEVWSTLEPWDATYWKRLPRGYSVNYRLVAQDPPDSIPEWVRDFDRETSHWYTNYWVATQ